MIAHKLVAGDTIYLEDGRPVRITNIGRGFGYNMLFIDFAQPASGEPVDFPWTCVSKNAEIGCERDSASLTSSPATRITPPSRAGTRSDSRHAHEGEHTLACRRPAATGAPGRGVRAGAARSS